MTPGPYRSPLEVHRETRRGTVSTPLLEVWRLCTWGVNLFPSTWSSRVRIQSTTRVGTAMEFNDQRSSLQPLKWDSDTGFCWISHLPPDQYEFANFSPKLCGIFKKAPVPLSRHLSPSSAFSLESRNFLDPLEWGRKTTEKTRLRTPSLREAPSVAVIYFGKK
jgi:hypothetical protein